MPLSDEDIRVTREAYADLARRDHRREIEKMFDEIIKLLDKLKEELLSNG